MCSDAAETLDENLFFREVAVRMASSLNVGVALRRTLTYLQTLMPVRIAILAMFEPREEMPRVHAMASASGSIRLDMPISVPPAAKLMLADLWAGDSGVEVLDFNRFRDEIVGNMVEEIRSAQAHTIERIYERLKHKPDPEHVNSSKIAVLLKVAEQRIAMMVLISEPEVRFTPTHARLIQLMGAPCSVAVSNALKHAELESIRDRLREENKLLREELNSRLSAGAIVGAEAGLKEVMDLVHRVAPLDAPVVLLGETGVGKEVIASAIHLSSARHDAPFITVDCGAIAESLIDSELFGHERGAFTGAASRKLGRFEQAHGGTIFLDEIGELPLASQTRLLRVLQSKQIERVGGVKPMTLDIRIVAATNRDLKQMVAEGTFRKDLWFRLDVFPISIPPLRSRRQDIPTLVHHFCAAKAREQRRVDAPVLAAGAMELLLDYDWPGNVRELANVVERALILAPEGLVTFDWLFAHERTPAPGSSLPAVAAGPPRPLDEIMVDHIRAALDYAGGKVNGTGGAAELLGVHPNTLRNRMRKLGIPFGRAAV